MNNIPSTVGASTYQNIKKDIIFGALAPGSKLKLEALKLRYMASLSTLREALNRLASDGFVESPEQRGFLVTPVSREDMAEISELRILLECHALKLSIENGDAEWEGNLVSAHHKLHLIERRLMSGEGAKKEIWSQYDWEFHKALIQACDSKNLLSLHSIIYDKFLRYQMLVLTYRGQSAVEEHKEMLEAALSRDAEGAARLLETHIRNGMKHTLPAL